MNYDALIENLTCSFDKISHLYFNPKYLPCCHKTVCDRCIVKACGEVGNVFKCSFCKETSRIKIIKDECDLEPNLQVQAELDRYMIDINHHLLRKLESSVNNVQERFDSNDEFLIKRRQFIEAEIHVQVAGLKAQLDDYEKNLKQKLNDSCRNAGQNLKTFCQNQQLNIDHIKSSKDDLKLKAFSYADNRKADTKSASQSKEDHYLNTLPQQNSINKIFQHISDLNKINNFVSNCIEEVKFYPNIEPFNEEVVGHLKTIKHIEQEEQFKCVKKQIEKSSIKSTSGSNKRMPISPQYLTVLDNFNMLFTDSHSRRLTQITLETGDFVQSTNLNEALRNPSGLCVNHKKDLIYVVDLEQSCIFKLDRNFNVLKQFGSRDLRLPRGIFYDETSHNGNCLYVCDQLNERVVIYNDQEQLRGEIRLTPAHRLVPSYNTLNKGSYSNEIEEEFKFSPVSVTVTSSHIYVCDEWVSSNCIRVFDKVTKDLIRNIGDLQAWNPLGTFIDSNDNIYTIARLYYETGVPYIFCFSKTGKLMFKTNLNISDYSDQIRDFLVDKYTDVTNYGLVVAGDSRLHFLRFE